MRFVFEILIGLLFVIGPVLVVVSFPSWLIALKQFIQSSIIILFMLVGLGLLFLGISELRS